MKKCQDETWKWCLGRDFKMKYRDGIYEKNVKINQKIVFYLDRKLKMKHKNIIHEKNVKMKNENDI